jgi:biotin carboxyl carrier protein
MKVHVKIGDRIFDVDIADISTRPIVAKVEGESFEVWPENENQPEVSPIQAAARQETAPKPASTVPAASGAPFASPNLSGKVMVAPLPGTVVEVFVKPGEYVESGHVMLVIEAMKMKNSIRATRAGKLDAVLVNPGQTVAHKQPLVEFSE